MRTSHSARAGNGPGTAAGEVTATVTRLRSGRFHVVVTLGHLPMTRRPVRITRTFTTEDEALAFRGAMLDADPDSLARLRDQAQVIALPPLPGYGDLRSYLVRGIRVMLDADLARMFGIRTAHLNQAVSRNRERFPADAAFRLTLLEVRALRSLGAIPAPRRGGLRRLPRAFTETGLLLLTSVLNSPAAVRLSVEIVRAVCAAASPPTPRPTNG